MKLPNRLFKSPTLHFLLIGGLLFGAQQAYQKFTSEPPALAKEELVIGKPQIEQIKRDIFIQTGMHPTPTQIQAGIEQAINDEILYRQALVLGLDRNNPSVRARLIQLGKFISKDPKASNEAHLREALKLGLDRSDLVIKRYLISVARLVAEKVPTPSEPATASVAELQAYLDKNPEPFLSPRKVKITQIYFSRDRRKNQAEPQAKELLEKLRADAKGPTEVSALGDPFLEGNYFPWLSETSLQRFFGIDFAKKLTNLPVGSWSGPIASSYGWHLVFVEGVRLPETPKLEAVANQVKSALFREREQRRLSTTLQRLRSGYSIRIEDEEVHANGPE